MQISRERIKQLDILGYIKKCDEFRKGVCKLEELDELVERSLSVEDERILSADTKTEEEKELDEMEWIYKTAARFIGLPKCIVENEYPFGINEKGISGKYILKEILNKSNLEKESFFSFAKYQLVEIVATNEAKRLWEVGRRRAEFDEAAVEKEIAILEHTRFPVLFLIVEGYIYAELGATCAEWQEVVRQLGMLLYFKQLVGGEQQTEAGAVSLAERVRMLERNGYFSMAMKDGKSQVKIAEEVATLFNCGVNYARKLVREATGLSCGGRNDKRK